MENAGDWALARLRERCLASLAWKLHRARGMVAGARAIMSPGQQADGIT